MGSSSDPDPHPHSGRSILHQYHSGPEDLNLSLMRFEASRLGTFRSWPSNARVEAGKIARAGFFRLHSTTEEVSQQDGEDRLGSVGSTVSTGSVSSSSGGPNSGLEVMCSWCGVVISEWDYGDQVMSRHRSASPNCPFIKNVSNNVPLNSSSHTMEPPPVPTSTTATVTAVQQDESVEDMEEGEITREEGEITDESANNTAEEDQGEIDFPDDAGRHLRRDVSINQPDHGEMEVDHGQQQQQRSSSDVGPSSSSSGGASASSLGSLPHADYRSERARLRSFAKWPLPFIHPGDLARTGFLYTGRSDCVRCVFCGEYVGEWEQGDDPAAEHANLFSHCPFVQGMNVGNIPLGEEGEEEQENEDLNRQHPPEQGEADVDTEVEDDDLEEGEDEVGVRFMSGSSDTTSPPRLADRSGGVQTPPVLQWTNNTSRDTPRRSHDSIPSASSSSSSSGSGITRPEQEGSNSGIVAHSGPAHPKHSTIESRLRTFRDWPPALKQTPKELADAGFYYIGLSDQVKCFYCDGGLRNWQSEDEPWTEHARWFSKCAFIRLVKGDEFIQECLKKTNEEEGEAKEGIPEPVAGPSKPSASADSAVNAAMSSLVAQQALSMGVDASRVKAALRQRMRQKRGEFKSVNELLEAAFHLQSEQEEVFAAENGEFERGAEDEAAAALKRLEMKVSPGGATASAISNNDVSNNPSSPVVASATLKHSKSEPSSTGASNSLSLPPLVKSQTCTAEQLGGEELERENRRLKEQRLCKICMDADVGVVFLPCGHLICCVQCAPALRDCPLCRKPITGTVKTYMS